MASIIRKAPLDACNLTFDDIRQLYSKLSSCLLQASSSEIDQMHKNWSGDNKQQLERDISDCYKISVVINGADGQSLVDSTDSVFLSPNLPDDISSIYFTSTSSYEVTFKRKPPNYFILNFDFSKPPLIDFITSSALPTPNGSSLEVYGDSETWVAGIFEIVQSKIRSKANSRMLLHKPHSYDVALWFLGIPVAMSVLDKMEPYANKFTTNKFTTIAVLIYTFIFCAFCTKALFSYTKWAFPKLEIIRENSKTINHRRWWFAIITGILASLAVGIRL